MVLEFLGSGNSFKNRDFPLESEAFEGEILHLATVYRPKSKVGLFSLTFRYLSYRIGTTSY